VGKKTTRGGRISKRKNEEKPGVTFFWGPGKKRKKKDKSQGGGNTARVKAGKNKTCDGNEGKCERRKELTGTKKTQVPIIWENQGPKTKNKHPKKN